MQNKDLLGSKMIQREMQCGQRGQELQSKTSSRVWRNQPALDLHKPLEHLLNMVGSGVGGEGSETEWPWPIVTESLPVRRRLHFAAILIALLSYLRLDCEAEWLNSGG